jgi:hypothetical protein
MWRAGEVPTKPRERGHGERQVVGAWLLARSDRWNLLREIRSGTAARVLLVEIRELLLKMRVTMVVLAGAWWSANHPLPRAWWLELREVPGRPSLSSRVVTGARQG